MKKATLHFQIDRQWADRKKGLARTYPELVKLGIMCAEKIRDQDDAKGFIDKDGVIENEFKTNFN